MIDKTVRALQDIKADPRFAWAPDYYRNAIDDAIFEVELAEGCRKEDRRLQDRPFEGERDLPNGCTLHWRDNGAGGREYYSTEVGGGVFVWDTCLVSRDTLLAAIVNEAGLRYAEETAKRKEARS